jgi:hypothetical protein
MAIMPHGAEEHLEHMEHAGHAAHDPFDRHVAMTMTIAAAVLACATMLSHRAHNRVLLLAGEANRLQTEANILHTQATDQWNFYQAKNIRFYQMQANLALLEVSLKETDGARKAQGYAAEWRNQIKKYEGELPDLQAKAEALVGRGHALEEEGQKKLEESEGAHQRGNRLDLAELGLELALVLCSLAVLSKRSLFWLVGMAIGVVGVVIAGTAFLH